MRKRSRRPDAGTLKIESDMFEFHGIEKAESTVESKL
jgi:hypothetical protein